MFTIIFHRRLVEASDKLAEEKRAALDARIAAGGLYFFFIFLRGKKLQICF
jgi:hypothetical protein